MKARIALLALVLAGRATAAEMDKQRLRQLAKLPTVSVVAGFSFSTTNGFSFNDVKPDPLVEIARIRKELKGDDSDVERYLRLGLFYLKADRKKESQDAYAKAVALCRQQVKEHPEDMHRLGQLGDALFRNGAVKETEALMRRAVKEAPNEWLAWLTLGECVDLRGIGAVLGDEHFTFQFAERLMNPALFAKRPKAEQIAEMRRLRHEARRCYDRAIELAPRETKAYLWRICSLWCHGAIEAGLRAAQGEHVNMMAAVLTPACAADARQIARLAPNDPKTVGMAVLVELLVCSLHEKSDTLPAIWSSAQLSGGMAGMAAPETTKDVSSVDLLPARSRDFARWGMDRLEQLTKSADKIAAADASEILADILLVIHMHDDDDKRPEGLRNSAEKAIPQIVKHLRRAVQLDPTRERAWDLLTSLLADKGQAAEAVVVARQRIETKDNAHNRFMLAKAYADMDKFADAARQLRAGLKCDENDLNCRLGLVAVLLRRDDAAALKQAGEQLDTLAPRMKQEKSKSRTSHYRLLRGLHAALSDHPKQAKEQIGRALIEDADNTTAAKALAALGLPVTPADEELAVAYLRARKAEIKRADKRPDSPVVKIRLTDDKIANDDLFFLAAFPQLRHLQLASDSIADAGLIHLKHLTALRRLELNCNKITDKGLIHLKPLTNLRSLDLDRTKVTDAGLAQLAALPHLQKLYATFGKITDDGMKHFEQCAELRELWLSGTDIRGPGLAHLKGLRHLRELHLDNTKITDAGLVHLKGLTELEYLDLSDTLVTDAGLVYLRGLTHLRELNLGEPFARIHREMEIQLMSFFPGQESKPANKPAKPRITDAGLEHLQGLTALETLDLTGRPLTDSGLAHLVKLPKLERLSLYETNITDAGLTHLHKLKRLKFVSLDKTKVTDTGIAELRKVFPKLDIMR